MDSVGLSIKEKLKSCVKDFPSEVIIAPVEYHLLQDPSPSEEIVCTGFIIYYLFKNCYYFYTTLFQQHFLSNQNHFLS